MINLKIWYDYCVYNVMEKYEKQFWLDLREIQVKHQKVLDYKANKEKSGIYRIIHFGKNKVYIGSTINFKIRKESHFSTLQRNKHSSMYLQNSFNKYGKKWFSFEIIEVCSKENLIEREQHYLDLYESYNELYGFNIRKIAESNRGIEFSKEWCNNISKSKKALNLISPTKGIPRNDKDKLTISKALKEYFSKNISANKGKKLVFKDKESWKTKIKNALKEIGFGAKVSENNSIPVIQLNLNGEFIKEFKSQKQASIETGVHVCSINACVTKRYKKSKNFKWMYKEEYDRLQEREKYM